MSFLLCICLCVCLSLSPICFCNIIVIMVNYQCPDASNICFVPYIRVLDAHIYFIIFRNFQLGDQVQDTLNRSLLLYKMCIYCFFNNLICTCHKPVLMSCIQFWFAMYSCFEWVIDSCFKITCFSYCLLTQVLLSTTVIV